MTKSLILGGVFGGVVLFAWSFVSWTVLPWHTSDLMRFKNEDEVAQVLARNMAGDGLYTMPAVAPGYGAMSGEQKKAADAKMEAAMQRGPVVYGLVRSGYSANMGKMMGTALFFDFLVALLLSMLVMRTAGMTYGGRVSFLVMIGLVMGLAGSVPNWIWFGYPARWVLTMIADTLIGMLLAGFVIARVAAPRAPKMA
ncbi:MAG: hypothetical protein HYR74_05410 [Candidatus Eisenbacteria bacterium]|nr:hypothetical protein [Candidatus Eisenbacteria bacterium]